MQEQQPKVVFKDPENKLYTIGYQDGKEKTLRNLENNLPADLKSINPRGPEEYLRGFIAGNEEVINEVNENQPKTR